mmetsp:Transcript_60492/g.179239  ORF Transcript_60492/g.179239 Transcript_60492/m.179239 type:complete len:241 (-) Transcript_60492:231-953(-)
MNISISAGAGGSIRAPLLLWHLVLVAEDGGAVVVPLPVIVIAVVTIITSGTVVVALVLRLVATVVALEGESGVSTTIAANIAAAIGDHQRRRGGGCCFGRGALGPPHHASVVIVLVDCLQLMGCPPLGGEFEQIPHATGNLLGALELLLALTARRRRGGGGVPDARRGDRLSSADRTRVADRGGVAKVAYASVAVEGAGDGGAAAVAATAPAMTVVGGTRGGHIGARRLSPVHAVEHVLT